MKQTHEQPTYCKEGKQKFVIYNKLTDKIIASYSALADAKSHIQILARATRNQLNVWEIKCLNSQ